MNPASLAAIFGLAAAAAFGTALARPARLAIPVPVRDGVRGFEWLRAMATPHGHDTILCAHGTSRPARASRYRRVPQ